MTVRASAPVDLDKLASTVDVISTTWEERAEEALIEALGDMEGRRVFGRVRHAVPSDYQARIRPPAAVGDLVNVARLLDGESDIEPRPDIEAMQITTSFGRAIDGEEDDWRFRVFLRGRDATIAQLVPILDHLGLHARDEHPSRFDCPDGPVFLYDIGVRLDVPSIGDRQHRDVQRAFVGLAVGTIESDGLNHLVLAAGLDRRQVAVLRLYQRYLRQAGFLFSPAYIEQALVRHPAIAAGLVALFDARFDPAAGGDGADDHRVARIDAVTTELHRQLDEVPALDDDRICRAFMTLIEATVRTNAFRREPRDEIAVKLLSDAIPFLPEPRPAFEIFVCSPWVEGVHLRGGRIARGGLRWSDRLEDFRTEVLGLVKAQMVKNAVIVPVGAKGGFVVKRAMADPADRDAVRAEGIDRYRRFISGLLDLTDNVVGSDVVHPPTP